MSFLSSFRFFVFVPYSVVKNLPYFSSSAPHLPHPKRKNKAKEKSPFRGDFQLLIF